MIKRRILIADNDVSLLDLLEDGIRLFCTGCQVELATDGCMALRQLREQPFDPILTNYDMPGMNSLDLDQSARQIFQIYRLSS